MRCELKGGDTILKNHKSKIIISSLVIVGILLIVLGSYDFKGNKEENSFSYEEYTENLEGKIEDFLKSVYGINSVKVAITLDTSSEIVYAQNQKTYDFITISNNGSTEPVVVTEVYPTVRGIAIACTGGDSDEIKMKVTELVSAYLGISSNRIQIVRFG